MKSIKKLLLIFSGILPVLIMRLNENHANSTYSMSQNCFFNFMDQHNTWKIMFSIAFIIFLLIIYIMSNKITDNKSFIKNTIGTLTIIALLALIIGLPSFFHLKPKIYQKNLPQNDINIESNATNIQ